MADGLDWFGRRVDDSRLRLGEWDCGWEGCVGGEWSEGRVRLLVVEVDSTPVYLGGGECAGMCGEGEGGIISIDGRLGLCELVLLRIFREAREILVPELMVSALFLAQTAADFAGTLLLPHRI